jgi:hypothetical protein
MNLPEGRIGQTAQYARDVLADGYQTALAGAAAFTLAALGVGGYEAASADSSPLNGSEPVTATADSLHSPHYLEKHMPSQELTRD